MPSPAAPAPASALTHVIGKTDAEAGVSMPLVQHLADTGQIAGVLWDRWLPPAVHALVARSFNGDEALARAAFVLLAGLHDIGKASPAFAADKRDCADSAVAAGFDLSCMHGAGRGEYHSVVGQAILEDWLVHELRATPEKARSLAVVVGSHHGVTPHAEDLQRVVASPHQSGMRDERWAAAQKEIADAALGAIGVSESELAAVAAHGLLTDAQVVLSGAVIMADWIASDSALFPIIPADETDLSGTRAETAWSGLALPPLWAPTGFATAQDGLDARFATAARAMSARPFQQAVLEAAAKSTGLLIVEAPMGEGKTEAALIAAEAIAARTGSHGIFIGLPTRATADAMMRRIVDWLARTVEGDSEDQRHVNLAHSKASLNALYTSLRGSDGSVTVHEWTQGRKRGALAPTVVGTIDQVLSAALQSRHLTMRHLGLASKVVVLDEVHAIDAFMGSYLDRALEWLGSYGVPVIALSATLPSEIRKRLTASYDRGAAQRRPSPRPAAAGLALLAPPPAAAAPQADPYTVLDGDIGYPVVTASRDGSAPEVIPVPLDLSRAKSVVFEKIDDELSTLTGLIRGRLAAEGGCIGVIRNTVARAQEAYEALAAELGEESVILTHSRFLAPERAERDRRISELLGPDRSHRPRRLVVVGTQVLEQSLDIDFDYLITDAAPTDVLLQRMGRLHRHAPAPRPASMAEPRCAVTGIDWESEVPSPAGERKLFPVYPAALMYRTLAVLDGALSGALPVRLPQDISPMVQSTYSPDLAPPSGWEEDWAKAQEAFELTAEASRRKSTRHQLRPPSAYGHGMLGFANEGVEVDDDEGYVAMAVRDIDPTAEIVLLQRGKDGQLRTMPSLPSHAGAVVPTESRPSAATELAVATSTISVPATFFEHDWEAVKALSGTYPGWTQSPWLKRAAVLEADESGAARIGTRQFRYTAELGFVRV